MATILSILASLLEKVGLQWLAKHKITEAQDAKNDANALGDADAVDSLSKWTRK